MTSIGLIGCAGGDDGEGIEQDPEVRDYSTVFSPLPETAIYPANNPFSVRKEELGELLFWDPILSGNQNVACVSCHHPDFAWADGRAFSVGIDGVGLGPNRVGRELTPIHSPTILNVAFTGLTINSNTTDFNSGGYFWDLRAETLEEQALGPIQNPVEMLGHAIPEEQALPEAILRLKSVPEYVTLFNQVFGEADSVTSENLAKALATFQRKVISPNTRFDQFLLGDLSALTEQEVIGLNKFIDGGCADCHSGPMLSDNLINDEEPIVGEQTVRTATLRNIQLTAPYMHDGSILTLREAVAIYEDRDDLDVNIGEGDIDDITAFLRTLTTQAFYKDKPQSVPSGLQVGGDID